MEMSNTLKFTEIFPLCHLLELELANLIAESN